LSYRTKHRIGDRCLSRRRFHRVLKNGKDTGWYTIQSDSPLAAQKIDGKSGTAKRRNKPIRGGIGMDDAGNVIID
jgi:hypothetical protein